MRSDELQLNSIIGSISISMTEWKLKFFSQVVPKLCTVEQIIRAWRSMAHKKCKEFL